MNISASQKPKNKKTIDKAWQNLSGKHRQVAESEGEIYPRVWALSFYGRRVQLDDWRYMAAQILHENGCSFRVFSVYDRLIDWDACEIASSDHEIAEEAGRCEKKTVSREIAMHKRLGIITIEYETRSRSGKLSRTRVLRPALPKKPPAYLRIRDNPSKAESDLERLPLCGRLR
jgi:hypothetical protein